ncbi:MAG: hypothetical protein ACR2N9_03370, partial [Acidimicrobiia bacterium]
TKKSIVTRDLDPGNLEGIEAELVSIGSAIKAEEFPAVVGSHCRRCNVRTSCPAQQVGAEAFAV